MTVESTTSRVQYAGNDSATQFAVPWLFLEDGHVAAVLSNGLADVLLVQGEDYSLSGAGDAQGGVLTHPLSGEPLAAGHTLTIHSSVPLTQEKAWSNTDAVDVTEIEKADDKLTRICQQLSEELGRCLKHPVSASAPDTDLGSLMTARDQALAARDQAVAARAVAEACAAGLDMPAVTGADAGLALLAGADGTWSLAALPRPNLLINPDFAINQRGVSGTLAGGDYGHDRWRAAVGGCAYSASGGVATITAGSLEQEMESPGLASRTVTVSALVAAGASVSVRLQDLDAVVLDNAQGGADARLAASFDLDASATGNVTVALALAGSAPCAFSRLKAEVGSAATGYVPPEPTLELMRCRRYFCKSHALATAPGTAGDTNDTPGFVSFDANTIYHGRMFPVEMRAAPTITLYACNGTSGAIYHSGGTTIPGVSCIGTTTSKPGSLTKAGGLTAGSQYFAHYTADAEL